LLGLIQRFNCYYLHICHNCPYKAYLNITFFGKIRERLYIEQLEVDRLKTLLTIIYGIITIAFIGFSHFQWIEKTTVLQAAELNGESNEANAQQETIDQLLPLTKNWPTASAEAFKNAIKQQKPFKIVIAGSNVLGGETGWAQSTKAKLLEAYGAENLSVEIREYDVTSDVFIAENKQLELANLHPDLLLFEPFILKNNGYMSIDTTLANLTTTLEDIKQFSPSTNVILMPANPIYNAKNYPLQIDSLKQYAEENQIMYVDHWGMWPDPKTEAVKEYLSPDQSQPNDLGHKVWSEFVSAYLISKQ